MLKRFFLSNLLMLTLPILARAHVVDLGTRGLAGTFEFGPANAVQLDAQVFFIPLPQASFLVTGVGGGWKWYQNDWFSFKTTLDVGYLRFAVNSQKIFNSFEISECAHALYTGLNIGFRVRIRLSNSIYYPINLGFILPVVLFAQQVKARNDGKDEFLRKTMDPLPGSVFLVPIPYLQLVGIEWN
jgi:hypothetical protein